MMWNWTAWQQISKRASDLSYSPLFVDSGVRGVVEGCWFVA